MGHQKLTYGFRGESTSLPHEDRFSPQNEADYERLARIAAAEEAGTDAAATAETAIPSC